MWIDFIENKRQISAIFGDELPTPDSLKIKNIEFDYLRQSVRLKADLSCYPANPTEKWRLGKFNTVHAVIEFWNVRSLSLCECTELYIDDLSVTKNEDGILCRGKSGFSCSCEVFDVLKLTGYTDSV